PYVNLWQTRRLNQAVSDLVMVAILGRDFKRNIASKAPRQATVLQKAVDAAVARAADDFARAGRISPQTAQDLKSAILKRIESGEIRTQQGDQVTAFKPEQRVAFDAFMGKVAEAKDIEALRRSLLLLEAGGGKTLLIHEASLPLARVLARQAGALRLILTTSGDILKAQMEADLRSFNGGALPKDVEIMTHQQLVERWARENTRGLKPGEISLKDSFIIADEVDAPFLRPAIAMGESRGRVAVSSPLYPVFRDLHAKVKSFDAAGRSTQVFDRQTSKAFAKRFADLKTRGNLSAEDQATAAQYAQIARVLREINDYHETLLAWTKVNEQYRVDNISKRITLKDETHQWSPDLDAQARRFLELQHGLAMTKPYRHEFVATFKAVLENAKGFIGLSGTKPAALQGFFKRLQVSESGRPTQTPPGEVILTKNFAETMTRVVEQIKVHLEVAKSDASLKPLDIDAFAGTRQIRAFREFLKREIPELKGSQIAQISSGMSELSAVGNSQAARSFNLKAVDAGTAKVVILEGPYAGRGYDLPGQKNYNQVTVSIVNPHELAKVSYDQLLGRVGGNRFAGAVKEFKLISDQESVNANPLLRAQALSKGLSEVTVEVLRDNMTRTQEAVERKALASSGVELAMDAAPRAPPTSKIRSLVSDVIPSVISSVEARDLAGPAGTRGVRGNDAGAVLQDLGLTQEQFDRLIRVQAAFEAELFKTYPRFKNYIFSLRSQQRFSATVLRLTREFRKKNADQPLALALGFAIDHYYSDHISGAGYIAQRHFREFIPESVSADASSRKAALATLLPLPAAARAPPLKATLRQQLERSLIGGEPALFEESAHDDQALQSEMEKLCRALGYELSVLWSHPFTQEDQLIGHRVSAPGKDQLLFGEGEILREIKKAQRDAEVAARQGRAPKRHVILIKNIEAMEPGVRTQLQELLRVGQMSHPELGSVKVPTNLQFFMTMRAGANLEDDSFYDRLVVKTARLGLARIAPSAKTPALTFPQGLDGKNYLKYVSVERAGGRDILVLPGAQIELAAGFLGIDKNNLQDVIYLKTGLVLDFETVRQLSAMAQAVADGEPILRVEGPTGLGKTFSAEAFAKLRGSSFYANPVNQDSEIADLIGGFAQDDKGFSRFNGETTFKQRLENGGVVALSELNTLLDANEKASIGWWLAQIKQAPKDAKGDRVIRLTEIPVPEGQEPPVIRIQPRALIVIDTNPKGEYAARGSLPDVLLEQTPVLQAKPLVSGEAGSKKAEIEKLAVYADMFLKHEWRAKSGARAAGIKDARRRDEAAQRLAGVFWTAAARQVSLNSAAARILSVRELKRMSEDYLASLSRGENPEQAITQAATAHLIDYLPAGKGREALIAALNLAVSRAAVAEFINEQMLKQGRPVHVRAPAGADVRAMLNPIEQAGAELTYVNVTNETSRFEMEGGLVATPSGDGFATGLGIFGRLIERARQHPDKPIVYVLDNAHNLRAEEVVALNEFLQQGRLHIKGQDTAMALPANAHILFVSRNDSPLEWSPAERSRFVEFAAAAAAPGGGVAAGLEDMLGRWAKTWPRVFVDLTGKWVAAAYSRWRAEALADTRLARLASESLERRFLQAIAEVMSGNSRRVWDEAVLKDVVEGLGDAVENVLFSALSLTARRQARKRYMKLLQMYEYLSQDASAVQGQNQAAAQAQSQDAALKQALLSYHLAEGVAAQKAALGAVKELVKQDASQAVWSELPSRDIEDLDVVKGGVLQAKF
ncbi:MAG: hypothetical protein AABZ44_02075, partial [Elusimicrobiota bacterium]